MKREREAEATTYSSCLIAQEKFEFEFARLRAEQLEADNNV